MKRVRAGMGVSFLLVEEGLRIRPTHGFIVLGDGSRHRIDKTAEFPWDNIRAINGIGLNAMFVPEAYGGAGLSYAAYLACVREISAACAATGSIWATNFHALKPLIDFGDEAQKRRLLPRIAGFLRVANNIREQ